jgi:hypothetical protein
MNLPPPKICKRAKKLFAQMGSSGNDADVARDKLRQLLEEHGLCGPCLHCSGRGGLVGDRSASSQCDTGSLILRKPCATAAIGRWPSARPMLRAAFCVEAPWSDR